ncbi:MAG TPA: lipocalin family protein [Mizugakiibacter sp.]
MRVLPRFVFAALFAAVAPARAAAPVRAIPDIDIARYLGTWHEIARLPLYFERNCARDITATYTANPDGTLGVHNACVKADGSTKSADGVARRPDPSGAPAELEVRFAPSWLGFLPFVWGDYWVIALDRDYRWAMVGEPSRDYLWILAREPGLDRATFEDLKARATAMGYDLAPLIVSGTVR